MPLKNPDPFKSRAATLDANVNPYVALLRDGARDGSLPLAFGEELQSFRGRWRERIREFHKLESAPERLVLEIGCHKGKTLMAMASDQKDSAFIGLDITFKRVVTTAQRVKALGLTNAFCAMANAQNIDQLFAPDELDGVVIFFPDPWIKKARQAKHRLVDVAFAERLTRVLKSDGYVWLKTDQDVYFQGAAAAFEAARFVPPSIGARVPSVDYSSSFEERFHAQNLPTYSGKWLRSAPVGAALA